MNPPPQPIDYAPARQWYQRVNWRKWAACFLVLVAASISAVLLPRMLQLIQGYRLQNSALKQAHSLTGEILAISQSKYTLPVGLVHDWFSRQSGRVVSDSPIIYFGKCSTPDDEERLLVLLAIIQTPRPQYSELVIESQLYLPATATRGPELCSTQVFRKGIWLTSVQPSSRIAKIFWGEYDHETKCRVAVSYEIDHEKDLVDCWIQTDGSILFEPRAAFAPATAPRH